MKNKAIRALYGRWKFNADLMTCQACGWSVIASRMHETAHHAPGCENDGDRNPWLQLAEILNDLKGGTISPQALLPEERECCGTFPRTPHRSTCKKYRGKKGQP